MIALIILTALPAKTTTARDTRVRAQQSENDRVFVDDWFRAAHGADVQMPE
jgi:hypothetical protein